MSGRNVSSQGFAASGWLMADLLIVLAFLALVLNSSMDKSSTPGDSGDAATTSTTPAGETLDPSPPCPQPGLDLASTKTSVVNLPVEGGEAEADELAGQILSDGRLPGVVMLFGVSWDGNELNGTLVSQAMESHLRSRLPEGTAYRAFLQGFAGGTYRNGDVYAEVFYFTSG